jgi:hypothetical protein
VISPDRSRPNLLLRVLAAPGLQERSQGGRRGPHPPGVTTEQLLAAHRAPLATAQMTAAGTPVTYLRSTFLTADQTCYCLFESPSEQAVK